MQVYITIWQNREYSSMAYNNYHLSLYNYIQKANAENLVLQLSIQKEEADVAYYQAIQKQLESNRILIHDIKNHLHTLHALATNNKISEVTNYISDLEASYIPNTSAHFCEDPILNLILIRFHDECQSKQITLELDIYNNCIFSIEAPAITTLFGNLFTNAIEAANASVAKKIELSISLNREQSSILISMINSCDFSPVTDGNGCFITSKHTLYHGIGLKSINRIVQKYGGISSVYYNENSKNFHHLICFPDLITKSHQPDVTKVGGSDN